MLAKKTKKLGLLALNASLIVINWLILIWSVNNEYRLDESLGYFINPLVSLLLATIFLFPYHAIDRGEFSRLRRINPTLEI